LSKIGAENDDGDHLEADADSRQPRPMKIASWNVNSISVRLPQLLRFLDEQRPDVLALQETKVPDERFPTAEIEATGYRVQFAGQKSYNGVAILSREPASDCVSDLPHLADQQRRLLAVTVNGVRIVNVYVPNGQEIGSEKYRYKFDWLGALRDFLQQQLAAHAQLVVLGDFNIAPADLDVHDPRRWHEKIMCSSAERQQFAGLLALGLVDTVRSLHPDEPMFSWWDYRLNAFGRGWGLRIDHLLASSSMRPERAAVATSFRAMERPSDHAPVCVSFA